MIGVVSNISHCLSYTISQSKLLLLSQKLLELEHERLYRGGVSVSSMKIVPTFDIGMVYIFSRWKPQFL